MNKKTNLFLGLLVTLLSIIGVFTLFSTAFGAGETPSVRGSLFTVMFGSDAMGYALVPGLLIAFILLCLSILVGLIASFMPGKLGTIVFGLNGLLLAGSGVLWCLAPSLYASANADIISDMAEAITLGTGCICALIFSFAGALLSFYGAYSSSKQ